MAALAPKTEIAFIGTPECEANDEVENNGRVEKVELTFHTEEDPSFLTCLPHAFYLETASGDAYLIGTREERPVVSVTTNTGVPNGTPAGYTVTVKLQALRALIGMG